MPSSSQNVHRMAREMIWKNYNDDLEKFVLIWLDPQVNKIEENRQVQQKLREIIHRFEIFEDQQRCQRYISSLISPVQVFLIVSGQYGRQFVPQIHQLRQLSCIYVYCMDKQANEQWAKDFDKVTKVIINQDDLINEIERDHRRQLRIVEFTSVNNFTTHDNSTTELNGQFIHHLLLIDVLMRMKSTDSDKKAFIKYCEENSSGRMKDINDFKYRYSTEKAIWWYSLQSFLYPILNESLRMQNIDSLFLSRFVIVDIYQQLKRHQCQSSVRVYRYQLISNEELERLQKSEGKLLSNNSFFSTTKEEDIAMNFLKNIQNPNNLPHVLLIIDADPRVVTSKPFADVGHLSKHPEEKEVLFMVGCLFRLNKIARDTKDGRIWRVNMTLCGDKENELKDLFNHMENEYSISENENVSRLSFADLLYKMGKYDSAEKMYNQLNLELPLNDSLRSDLYWSLGMLHKAKGDYDISIKWFNGALKMYNKKPLRDHVRIAKLYNWIGEMYRLKGEDSTALRYFHDAELLFEATNDGNHLSMGDTYNNMGIIYKRQKQFSAALEFYNKSLTIRQKHLPAIHSDIASLYNNIGNVYYDFEDYEWAMEYYQKTLDMYIKTCPAQHPDIGMSYQNIGHVHESRHEWKKAMENYKKAAEIYRNSFEFDHPDVIHIQREIDRVNLVCFLT